MAEVHRDANAGRINQDVGILENLSSLPDHLHLFLRIAVVQQPVDLRYDVEGHGFFPIRLRRDFAAIQECAALRRQQFHGKAAGAGDGLVGGYVDALDPRRLVDGLQRHHHLDRRAVGIGNDAAIRVLGDAVRIALRHHQGNVVVVAELRGIVDDDCSGRSSHGRCPGRNRGAGGEQAHGDPAEIEIVEHADFQTFAPELHGRSCGSFAGQRVQPSDGELPSLENLQQRLTDGTGRPGDGHIVGCRHDCPCRSDPVRPCVQCR